jgi:deazaflavin-dependent oxidoreductase (nitroreductase family)
VALTAPDWYTRLARWLGHRRWFAYMMRHLGWRVDRFLLRVSNGRVDLSGPDIPTMLLTTTGRRTGTPHTVPISYVRDGNNLVAVCEDFGLVQTSNWPANAIANPQVTTEVDGVAEVRVARRALPDEEARSLPSLVTAWPAHDTYLQRSGHRQVIVFEPAG